MGPIPTCPSSLSMSDEYSSKGAKVCKMKQNVKICHGQEEPKKTQQMSVMWCPEGDPGTEKGQEVKTKKNPGEL